MSNSSSPSEPAAPPRVLLTAGEPAGIGPDLAVQLAGQPTPCELVCVADPALLEERSRRLGLALRLTEADLAREPRRHTPGELAVLPVELAVEVHAGRLDTRNVPYVLQTLRIAAQTCREGLATAMVTAPVHKGVINDAGVAFSGHTEFLAALTGADPVMLLVAGRLRVALATTHLALRDVPAAIDAGVLERVLRILHRDLVRRFALERPRIAVCGLNPHAGEGGHLGDEEIRVIAPALAAMREEGLTLIGPLPADTAFTPARLAECDAVLAMYHDQGLPVLKHAGFGHAVNVTLGLPIIRTSVDHGTALELAGTGRADPGSLLSALALAIELAGRAAGSA